MIGDNLNLNYDESLEKAQECIFLVYDYCESKYGQSTPREQPQYTSSPVEKKLKRLQPLPNTCINSQRWWTIKYSSGTKQVEVILGHELRRHRDQGRIHIEGRWGLGPLSIFIFFQISLKFL